MADEPADLHESLTDLLASEGIDRGKLREIAMFFHPVDLAEFLEDLDLEDRARIFEVLEPERAARVLEALPHAPRVQLVDRIGEERLSNVIDQMSADAVADMIDHLPAHRETAVLAKVGHEQRRRIETLRRYAPNTAGGLMTKNYIAVQERLTAGWALRTIQGAVDAETTEYVYVVDAEEHLVGVCSIRSILRARPEKPVKDIMTGDVTFVGATMDQEEVAKIVQKYSFKAIPVVDNAMKLIGIVTQARILEVVHQEAGEDILKLAGAGHIHPLHSPLLARLRARIPWLAVALLMELALAWIMRGYGRTLEHLALAYFIPVIMAMGGSIGLQSSTMVVRGLATGELTLSKGVRVVLAEIRVGVTLGLLAGLVTGAQAFVMQIAQSDALVLAGVVFASMATSMSLATLMGTLTPLVLQRFGYDPAMASGPFLTAVNDVVNVTIYLTLATLLIGRMA